MSESTDNEHRHELVNVPDEVVTVEQVLSSKGTDLPPLITVDAHAKVRQAVDLLHRHEPPTSTITSSS